MAASSQEGQHARSEGRRRHCSLTSLPSLLCFGGDVQAMPLWESRAVSSDLSRMNSSSSSSPPSGQHECTRAARSSTSGHRAHPSSFTPAPIGSDAH